MSPRWLRVAGCCLMAALAAAPAGDALAGENADGGNGNGRNGTGRNGNGRRNGNGGVYVRNGSGSLRMESRLRLGVEHIVVDTGTGERDGTSFVQEYASDVRAPLLSPAFGTARITASFEDGENVSERIRGSEDPGQQSVGYEVTGNLFSDSVQRYLRVEPLYRRAERRLGWIEGEDGAYVDTTTGGKVGLSVPGLPGVSVAYDRTARRNGRPDYNRDIDHVYGTASYRRGPVDLRLDRRVRMEDPLVPGEASTGQDTTSGSGDASFRNLGVMGVDSVHLRVYYRGIATTAAEKQRSDDLTQTSRLISETKKIGGVDWNLSYGQELAARLNGETWERMSHDGNLNGRFGLLNWSVLNIVEYRNTPVPGSQHNSVGDRLSLRSPVYWNTVEYQAEGRESYRWGGSQEPAVQDFLDHRVNLYPNRILDLYVRHGYNGDRRSKLSGPAQATRVNSLGGGGTLRPFGFLELRSSYDRSTSRGSSAAAPTVGDSVTLGATILPAERASLSASYAVHRGSIGTLQEQASGTLSGQASYAPVRGLNLSARVHQLRRDETARDLRAAPFDTEIAASYAIGRTTVTGIWEKREIGDINSYNRFNASLTRTF